MTTTATEQLPPAGAAVFFAKTATPAEWRLVAAAIKNVCEEATFYVGPDGLRFAAMTPDKFRLLLVEWPAKAFHKYACPKGTALTVVVDQFAKALARAGGDDSVEVTTTDAGLLKLLFRGGEPKDFELHLLGAHEFPRLPEVEFPSTVVFAPGAMDEALADVAVVSNEFRFTATGDGVQFAAGDLEMGNARSNLPKGSPGLLRLEPGPESTAIYSVEQVEPVLRALKGAQSIEAAFGTGKPLRLKFKLNDGGAVATFWASPRHVGGPEPEAVPPEAEAA